MSDIEVCPCGAGRNRGGDPMLRHVVARLHIAGGYHYREAIMFRFILTTYGLFGGCLGL